MGAAGVQLGTRFVCATESIAHPNFKKAFIRASARDAVASVQIDPRLPVIPVRALKNAGGELFTAKQREVAQALDEGKVEMAEAQLQIEHYWAGALRRAVIDGDVEHGSVMAGQSVGMVTREEPVADILATLMDEGHLPRVPIRSLIYIVSAAAQAPFTLAYEVRHAYGVDTAAEAEIEAHADALIRVLIRE